jgi:hypothetical protein
VDDDFPVVVAPVDNCGCGEEEYVPLLSSRNGWKVRVGGDHPGGAALSPRRSCWAEMGMGIVLFAHSPPDAQEGLLNGPGRGPLSSSSCRRPAAEMLC